MINLKLFIYFICVCFIACIIFLISYFLSPVVENFEKFSVYECGFLPFEDSRGLFDSQFYIVAVLFIIFDLEIIFLFPWAKNLRALGNFGFWVMVIFLFVLILGFIFEWRKGSLNWSKRSIII